LVLPGEAGEPGQRSLFIEGRWQVKGAVEADARRHGLLDQLTAAVEAKGAEHCLLLRGVGPQMAAQERVELLQLMQGWRLGHVDALFLDQVSWRLISLGRIADSAGNLALAVPLSSRACPLPKVNEKP